MSTICICTVLLYNKLPGKPRGSHSSPLQSSRSISQHITVYPLLLSSPLLSSPLLTPPAARPAPVQERNMSVIQVATIDTLKTALDKAGSDRLVSTDRGGTGRELAPTHRTCGRAGMRVPVCVPACARACVYVCIGRSSLTSSRLGVDLAKSYLLCWRTWPRKWRTYPS